MAGERTGPETRPQSSAVDSRARTDEYPVNFP